MAWFIYTIAFLSCKDVKCNVSLVSLPSMSTWAKPCIFSALSDLPLNPIGVLAEDGVHSVMRWI